MRQFSGDRRWSQAKDVVSGPATLASAPRGRDRPTERFEQHGRDSWRERRDVDVHVAADAQRGLERDFLEPFARIGRGADHDHAPE
jgi:hypothetical protein